MYTAICNAATVLRVARGMKSCTSAAVICTGDMASSRCSLDQGGDLRGLCASLLLVFNWLNAMLR